MAYISTAEVKVIRDDLKEAFPRKEGWKFSVRRDHHSAVRVAIMESPVVLERFACTDFRVDDTHPVKIESALDVNPYHIESQHPKPTAQILEKIRAIVAKKHWDKSDSMTDYFHCAFYYSIEIGKWDRPIKYV